MNYKSRKNKNGFTLLELLISMSVTIIILGIMFLVTKAGFESLDEGRSDTTSTQKARLALTQLTEDLESIVYQRGNRFEWLVADITDSQVTDLETTADGFKGFYSNLAFFTIARDRYNGAYLSPTADPEENNGDVSIVRYGIRFLNPVSTADETNRKMVLYRQIVDPNASFAGGEGYLGKEDLLEVFTDSGVDINDSKFIITDNIRELTVNFTVQYITDTDEIKVVRVPLIALDESETGNHWDNIKINGKGLFAETDAIPSADQEAFRKGTIQSIEVNAQILPDGVDGLLNIGTNPPKAAIEKEITRFSKTIYVPQLN